MVHLRKYVGGPPMAFQWPPILAELQQIVIGPLEEKVGWTSAGFSMANQYCHNHCKNLLDRNWYNRNIGPLSDSMRNPNIILYSQKY